MDKVGIPTAKGGFVTSKKEAIDLFYERKEDYKIKIIQEADQDNDFQIYQQENSDFVDLCKGPHLPDLKKVGFREGKKIGEVLVQTKKWWIEQNYSPLKKQCIKFAMQLLPASSGR